MTNVTVGKCKATEKPTVGCFTDGEELTQTMEYNNQTIVCNNTKQII